MGSIDGKASVRRRFAIERQVMDDLRKAPGMTFLNSGDGWFHVPNRVYASVIASIEMGGDCGCRAVLFSDETTSELRA